MRPLFRTALAAVPAGAPQATRLATLLAAPLLVALLAALLAALAPAAARAERLVLSVSQPVVLISSNFTGADLVLFGAVEGVGEMPAGTYDVVATVRGPAQTFVTWRKSRVLGIWMNTQSRTFLDVPAFLAVATNRPATAVAGAETLRREQIGLERNVFVQRLGPDFADVVPQDPFRAAFLRIRQSGGFYQEDPGGVRFLSPTAFRAELPIPGRAPIGPYTVSVALLRGGQKIAEAQTGFEVQKAGFEARLTSFARAHGVIYGLSVALGSLAIGFVANLLFRRE